MAKKKKRNVLLVKQVSAVKLFEELGYKTASKWSPEKLSAKMKNLPELTDGVKIKNPKIKARLKKILEHKKVKVVPTEEATELASEKKARKAKVRKGQREAQGQLQGEKKQKRIKKKTTKKTTKKANAAKEKDNFGSVIGTKPATINKALSRKPMIMKELVKRAKLSGTYYDHLNSLIKRKFVKKTEKGFVLTGK